MKDVARENVERESERGVMSMIVLSFNECCAEVPDSSTHANREASRIRRRNDKLTTGPAKLSLAKAEPANWSSWFSHYFGPEGKGEVVE